MMKNSVTAVKDGIDIWGKDILSLGITADDGYVWDIASVHILYPGRVLMTDLVRETEPSLNKDLPC